MTDTLEDHPAEQCDFYLEADADDFEAEIEAMGLSAHDKQVRRLGLGGSDANRVVNGQHEEIQNLIWEKRGDIEPEDLSNILAVVRGTHDEKLNSLWFRKMTGRKVYDRGVTLVHPLYSHYRCNLDGRTTLEDGRPAIWEAKSSGTPSIEPLIRRYFPQIQHNADVAGEPAGVLSCFMGFSKWAYAELDADDEYLHALRLRMDAVWDVVQSKDGILGHLPPVPRFPEPEVEKVMVDLTTLPSANLIAHYASTFLETEDAARACQEAKEQIKELFPKYVTGGGGFGIVGIYNSKGSLTIRPEGASRRKSKV